MDMNDDRKPNDEEEEDEQETNESEGRAGKHQGQPDSAAPADDDIIIK
jgi:hypothetical protein